MERDAGPSDRPELVDVTGDIPEDIPEIPMGTLRSIALGGDFTCVVRSDDSVWCWGANDRGQLGVGTTAPVTGPVRVRGLGRGVLDGRGQGATRARCSAGAACAAGAPTTAGSSATGAPSTGRRR
jgi:hypothetical protein